MNLSDLTSGERAALQNLLARGLSSMPKAQRAATEGLVAKLRVAIDEAEMAERAARTNAQHVEALEESVERLITSGGNVHDDGLIKALLLAGADSWTIARRLGVSDGYVRGVAREVGRR